MHCDVEEHQVAPIDDQIPMDSEDTGAVNDGVQSVDARDILLNNDKFEAHLKEIDSGIQFQNLIEHDTVSNLPINSEVGNTGVVLDALDSPLVDAGTYQVGSNLEGHSHLLCFDPPSTGSMELANNVPNNYKRKFQEDVTHSMILNQGKKARGVHEIKEFSKVLADGFKSAVSFLMPNCIIFQTLPLTTAF